VRFILSALAGAFMAFLGYLVGGNSADACLYCVLSGLGGSFGMALLCERPTSVYKEPPEFYSTPLSDLCEKGDELLATKLGMSRSIWSTVGFVFGPAVATAGIFYVIGWLFGYALLFAGFALVVSSVFLALVVLSSDAKKRRYGE
jgi:hypothetical protein